MNQRGPGYPPPPAERPARAQTERHRSGLPVLVFILGLCAWIAAAVAWNQISHADPLDIIRYQTLAIVLAIVGTGLVIVATLYDIADRP